VEGLLSPLELNMVTLAREQVQLVEYLFKRLSQLGIKAVHGVPGDFNIVALDYIYDAGLEWVGDANELNAGTSLASLAQ
jgi:pyruvate decarboxylase